MTQVSKTKDWYGKTDDLKLTLGLQILWKKNMTKK